MWKHQFEIGVLLASIAQSCSFLSLLNRFDYNLLAKTTSMLTLEKVKEKDKVPVNVSFTAVKLIKGIHTRNEMPRSLKKELIAQVSSFFSSSPKA